MKNLDKDNLRRNEIAKRYSAEIKNDKIRLPVIFPNMYHAFHLFVVETEKRDELAKYLNSKGIGTALHYPLAIHQQPAYKERIRGGDILLNTESLYKNILTIPMYPELSDEEVETIIKALKEWDK